MATKRLLLALAVLVPLPAGATVEVNGTNYNTITQALNAAGPGDTLYVGAGTYNESVFIDKNVTIEGAGLSSVTWNGASGSAVITLSADVSLTMEHLTIRNGGVINRRAISAIEGNNTVVLDDVNIDADHNSFGGVLYAAEPASITIRGSTLAGFTTSKGGAIYASISSGTFPLLIEDTRFNASSASSDGGAIWASNANLTCTRCSFEKTTGSQGGAIYTTGGQLTLQQSLVCATSGVVGGGIYSSSTATIRSTRFVQTVSSNQGGAINVTGGTWIIENNHFLGITSGGLFGAIDLGGGSTTLRNNLFYANTTLDINQLGGSSNVRYNWIADVSAGVSLGTTNIITTDDPELDDWNVNTNCNDDSLWPTPIHSPLIDAGDPNIADPDGTVSDIGAYGGIAADLAFHRDDDNDDAPFFHDCNDADPNRSAWLEEVCDNIDNDCNDIADDEPIDIDSFYADCDGDEQGDEATMVVQCFAPPTPPACGGQWLSFSEYGNHAWSDCNDADIDTYLGAPESCDPGDQNCDGSDDDGAFDANTWYLDNDGDGFGGDVLASCAETPPPGAVAQGEDCDDTLSSIRPGAPDACGDGIDSDCNGGDGDDVSIRTWFLDSDQDGYGDVNAAPVLDCSDRSPAYTSAELALDCDDDDVDVHPDAVEVCNEIDDDCNTQIDDAGEPLTYFPDTDGDGYGYELQAIETACPPVGFILDGGDCNDANPNIHPDAVEICNDVDDDCDDKRDAEDDDAQGVELVWEDWDQDGFGSCDEDDPSCAPFAICPEDRTASHADNADDCNDTNPGHHPGAVEINGNDLDEDCNGQYGAGPAPDPHTGCNCSATPGSARMVAPLLGLMLLSIRRRRQ